ncbi:MAG: hypothetical protein Q9M92_03270 [Enterobacterales bacterium]|nr:hypothetical protein [Enterobacterales bacterium]
MNQRFFLIILLFVSATVSATECNAIFPGSQSFATNGSSSIDNDSQCNGGNCNTPPTFTTASGLPSLNPTGQFNQTTVTDGVIERTSWGLPEDSQVDFVGTGTSVIYFSGSVTIPKKTKINPNGSPENVLIIIYGDLVIEKDAVINAVIYVVGNTTINKEATFNGALSTGGALDVSKEGNFNFNSAYINNLNSYGFCSAVAVDHFEILHDGNGSTCATETIIIKACADANCSSLVNGTTSLSLTLNGVAEANVSFNGSTNVSVNHVTAETVALDLSNINATITNPLVCDDGTGSSCDIIFDSTGCPLVNSCATYFPDSLQGHNAASSITFKDNGQVFNDSNNILTFPSLDDSSNGGTNTCNTANCSVSSSIAPALTLPPFKTTNSNTSVSINSGNITIGTGGTYATNELAQLNVSGSANVTFLTSNTDYIVSSASFTGGTVTFNPGVYWFDFLEILDNTQVIVNGPVTLFINQHFDIENSSQVNAAGPASALALVGYDKFHLKDDVIVKATIYANGPDLKFKDNAQFTGALSANGEVKIEDSASVTYADISSVQIADLCGGSAGIDHYLIEHDGMGLTCESESIVIKACMDAGCTSLSTDSTTLELQANGTTFSTTTFTGSSTETLVQTTPATLTLGIVNQTLAATNGFACSTGASSSCDIVFSDTGFKFFADAVVDTIGLQIAGKNSDVAPSAQTITIRAIQSDPATGQCDALINNTTATIDFAYACEAPASCAINTNGLSINNSQTIDDLTIGYSPVSINFDATGTGNLNFNYFDTGQIRLFASASLAVGNSNVTVQGSSNSFIVRPFAYDLQITGTPNATSATSPVFTSAGASFTTTLRSILWQSADDTDNNGIADSGADLTDNGVTPNISNIAGTVALSPIAQVVVNDGALSASSINFSSFVSGLASVSQSWSEVGIMTINSSTPSFMGTSASVSGNRPNIGRFVPDHLQISAPIIIEQCGSFTFGGFNDGVNAGLNKSGQTFDISGSITALNSNNATTLNYSGNFAKLTAADIALQAYNTTANSNASGQVNYAFSALNFVNGVSNYADAAADYQFALLQAPFALRIDLTATDSDMVSSGLASSNAFEVRNGRLRLVDSFGPETSDLEMRLFSEYYDGSLWKINTADSCSIYQKNLASFDLTSYTELLSNGDTSIYAPSSDQTLVNGVSALSNGLWFSAPGIDKYGSVQVNMSLASQDWLKFDWTEDLTNDDATAGLNFGIYRGSDRVIYWKEIRN